MAARQALSIGLILDSCFQNLDAEEIYEVQKLGYGLDEPLSANDLLLRRTIRACILVNNLWFKHASEIIWKYPEPCQLGHIEPTRRQIYASKVRSLRFFEPCEGLALISSLNGLEFPRLEKLGIDCHHPGEEPADLTQYLQSRLKTLDIYRGWFDFETLLDGLRRNCTGLRRIFLNNPERLGSLINEDGLLSILEALPNLHSITLGMGWHDLITSRVIFHLASRSNLLKLMPGGELNQQNLEGLRAIEMPFRNLESISTRIHLRNLPLLIRSIPSVKRLHLRVGGQCQSLRSISALAGLTKLEIRLDWMVKDSALDPSEVVQLLESLHHIQDFRISALRCQPPKDWLYWIAKEKPLLEVFDMSHASFEMSLMTQLSQKSDDFFQSASRLKSLEVAELWLAEMLDIDEEPLLSLMHEIARALYHLFPNLQTLVLRNHEGIGDQVIAAIENLRQSTRLSRLATTIPVPATSH